MKVRQCEIVCDVEKMNVDVQKTLKEYSTIKQWAYIIHDKDDTRPHYHIYLKFDYAVEMSIVGGWFGLAENFVNKIKGKKTDMLLYLTHANDSAKHKYQYSPSEVVANFDFEVEIENSKIIGDFDTYSYAQQLEYINTLPISEKTKAFTQLKKLWELHCRCLAMKSDRKLHVIFITGKAGCGKTFYAKKMLETMKLDYCISSSSNDPFQDYMGQKAMILDDLRDRSFDLEDLLKILDNNTKSSVRSRFNNKVFNGEVLVITSSVPLHYWYSINKTINSIDNLEQLYRRIGCYVFVSDDFVRIYDDGVDKDGKPLGLATTIPNDLVKKIKSKKEKMDISSIFKKIEDNGV